jgi:hypothetical protein
MSYQVKSATQTWLGVLVATDGDGGRALMPATVRRARRKNIPPPKLLRENERRKVIAAKRIRCQSLETNKAAAFAGAARRTCRVAICGRDPNTP